MEEILASIRRIIEDNDAGRKPGNEPEPARPAESRVIEVDAFRADLRTPPLSAMESAKPERAEPERKPVTLAEVQAQVAAEARFGTPRWTPEAAPQPTVPEATSKPAIAVNATKPALPDTASKPALADVPPRPAATPFVEQESQAEPEAEAMPPAEEPKPVAAIVPAVERPAPAEPIAAKSAILSERAERQVAAAFGELSEAFAQRSKKTFDEMAEAMLRPMLQEWLDNNLPGLVERLVREEIERVARGG